MMMLKQMARLSKKTVGERRSSLLSQLKDVVGKRESWEDVERLISKLEDLV